MSNKQLGGDEGFIENIISFNDVMLNGINSFLAETQRTQFCSNTLKAISELNENDLLGFKKQCRFIRGDVLFFDADHDCFGLNKNGLNLRQILNEYKSSLNKDDYEEEEYSMLLRKHMAEIEKTVARFGLILETSSSTRNEVLMLNSKYEPIFESLVNFDY